MYDVEDSHEVYHLWLDRAPGREYSLLENRKRTDFDAALPGAGLLISHMDEAIADNTTELQPLVRLVLADGGGDLGSATNRGDAGDPFPGSRTNRTFTGSSAIRRTRCRRGQTAPLPRWSCSPSA